MPPDEGKPERGLIADDDQPSRTVRRAALEGSGVRPRLVSSLARAIGVPLDQRI